jgi:hypothetical protein
MVRSGPGLVFIGPDQSIITLWGSHVKGKGCGLEVQGVVREDQWLSACKKGIGVY